MSKYRRAAKVDANQSRIVAGLRCIPGVSVQTGHDDILVGFRGRTYWFEIKRPECKSRLMDSQKRLRAEWSGHYAIVSSLEEILSALELIKPEARR